MKPWSRRQFLKLSSGLAVVGALSLWSWRFLQSAALSKSRSLSSEDLDWATILAFADVILPKTDKNPSASETDFKTFLNNLFLGKLPAYGLVKSKINWTHFYGNLTQRLDEKSRELANVTFLEASTVQKIAIVTSLSGAAAAQVGAPVRGIGYQESYTDDELFFNARNHVLQAFFADPCYGGNKNYAGWQAVGYVCHFNYPNRPENCPPMIN